MSHKRNMRHMLAAGLVLTFWGTAAGLTPTFAQESKPAQGTAGKPAANAPPAAPAPTIDLKSIPGAKDVLVTVNDQPITKAQIVKFMRQIELAPGTSAVDAYNVAVHTQINSDLLRQFLMRQPYQISRQDIETELRKITDELKSQEKDLASSLIESGMTPGELNLMIEQSERWKKYFLGQATDANLKKFVMDNKDFFYGARVRARHILIKAEPNTSPEDKTAKKQKLLAYKAEIESGKLDFADAANKYSEDEGNIEVKSGGDLGTFRRKGDLIEEFAAAAFAQKPGVISEPIETEFGFHLILVTEKDNGKAIDFDKEKEAIKAQFELDLRERILAENRKTAKIDIKPMPADMVKYVVVPPTPLQPAADAQPIKPGNPNTPPAATPKP